MNGFSGNIEKLTLENSFFRKVIFTAPHSQLVLMSLKPGEEIGLETHDVDQFFRFEAGQGKVMIGQDEFEVKDGDSVVVSAAESHNIINTGSNDLKLYTIYSPANHPDGTIHKTKAEADQAESEEHHKV